MRPKIFLIVSLCISLFGRSSAKDPIMPLSEIKPGMVGVGKTVFEGTKIEEFGVEILGVLPNLLGPKQDIILVRLKGDKVKFTGVVAGMSGSPIYVDGKLIGALSLRFGLFSKEPIAGVTPIEDMLKVNELATQAEAIRWPDWASIVGGLREPAPPTGSEVAAAASPAMGATLAPIKTPLVFSGFHPRVVEYFAPYLERYNCIAVQGGSSRGEEKQDSPFVPGAAVSAQLVRGDLSLAGTGTLTYVDGDKVLAFGHPFFQFGPVDMPMTKAEVLTTLSSEMASFKIVRPTELVGSIKQDRLTAIMGVIGAEPEMIPVVVRLRTEDNPSKHATYRFEIFQNKFITPLLLWLTLANALFDNLDYSEESTLELNGRIKISGYPEVILQNRYTNTDFSFFASSPPFSIAAAVASIFDRIFNNSFEAPKVNSVELDFKSVAKAKTLTVDALWSDRQDVKPGDVLPIRVFLKPYRGQIIVKEIKVNIPSDAPRGQLSLLVGDARSVDMAEGRAALFVSTPGAASASYQASTLAELVDLLNRSRRNDFLYAVAFRPLGGAIVKHELMPALPLSVLSVLDSDRTATNIRTVRESALFEERFPVDYVVSGSKRITITVK